MNTERGHLDFLKWLHANGFVCTQLACEKAAGAGQLEVLKWLRANGTAWNELTCMAAAAGGHLEVNNI